MPSGYYLTTDSPPNIREFPIAERPGSSPLGRRMGAIGRHHTDLEHITEEGVVWNYPQYRGRDWSEPGLIYRCTTEAHLEFFETLHLNVDGRSDPFWFIPDVDEPSQQLYLVRKVDKDFLPPALDTPTVINGIIIGVYDYVLRIREESPAAYILA